MPAPVAISTGDAINYPNLMTGGGGSAGSGAIDLFANGNISADGATGPMNLHFGLAEGSDGQQLHRVSIVGNSNDQLSVGSGNSVGTGNVHLACTGDVNFDTSNLMPLGQRATVGRCHDDGRGHRWSRIFRQQT